MDLIWGYTGILSLGHGLFFALGGYAMGMYLMRQIGRDGQYQSRHARLHGVPQLEGVPLALGALATRFVAQLLLVVLVPGPAGLRVRLLRLPLAHQGRLLLDHHAGDDLRAMLLFFRNETGFGGNNGFTDFKRILGIPIATPSMRMTAVRASPACTLIGFFLMARAIVRQQVRPRAAGDPRRREPRHVHRLRPAALQARDLDALGGDVRRSPARSTCRRSASSTRAR